ncbi:hypothetical protein [Methylorubrum sp. SB2]|uniref:hypothetical protein n=1 Tax=Methylorubrum subtropicum TaxID=3138812 RepID=UPI00313DB0AD
MPSFLTKFAAEIAKGTFTFVLGLFCIGGATRVADFYQIKPAQSVLSIVDGVLVQERSTVVAQGPVVVVSDTSVLTGEPAAR